MHNDPVQNIARLVEEVVRSHGAEALVVHLSSTAKWQIYAELQNEIGIVTADPAPFV
jgi:hypothetical protein